MRAGFVCALFVLLQGLYVATSTGRLHVTDEASAFFQARDLVEAGSLTVPSSTTGFVFYGERDRHGRLRAPNGPLHAIVLVPYYLLGKLMALVPGVPESSRDLVLAFAVVLSSTTCSALAAALFLALLLRRGTPPRVAVTVAVAFAVGTPLFAYSAWLFSEPLATALLVGAALCVFGDARPPATGHALLGGLLLGACVLVRPGHALAAPAFAAALLVRDGRRGASPALTLGAAASIGVAIALAWNTHLFGNPLDFGYPAIADGGKRINGFDTPLLSGLAGFLLSPGKSIFVYAPLAAIGIPASRRLARADRGLALLAVAMPVGYLLLYARYTQWEGGYCVGPRYLLPTLPFLLLALGRDLAEARPAAWRTFIVLTAAGVLVQAISLATSFLEDQYASGYYDQAFNYRMSYAPLYSQSALFVRYLLSFVRGEPAAPLGAGFDRWFVFLHKAGVSWWPIVGLILAAMAIVVGAAGHLVRLSRPVADDDERFVLNAAGSPSA
ncbi:MAG TPA: hypothetical protein VKE51_12430 [Vicinamibacterales bacterium]|nr:hypothetical protein [Vicinamibacterales bacterium]